MAGRLIRIESTRDGYRPVCTCGWQAREPRVSLADARWLGDWHRNIYHPRQATFVASQRRRRALNA